MTIHANELIVGADGELLSPEEISYYYDAHPTKEDKMGQSEPQIKLILYFRYLLEWVFRHERWFIGCDINIYKVKEDPRLPVYPITPDVAVFKEVQLNEQELGRLRSWKMVLPNRPAPSVVIEIASYKTWQEDLTEKPTLYQDLGVKEYFAYDPNLPTYWPRPNSRIRGWRYQEGKTIVILPNERGWLWSEELNSWLVPDKGLLQLYDQNGQRRLSKEEYLTQEARQREQLLADEIFQAQQREQALLEKLRQKGIDPDTL